MLQSNYTIEELEDIVFNVSKCYNDSVAFRVCLEQLKHSNIILYKDMLYREALDCGGLD